MKSKRQILHSAVLVVLLFGLAACAPSGTSTIAPTAETSAPAAAVEAPSPAEEAAGAPAESGLVSPSPGAVCDTSSAPAGDPIVVGGSLSLTGFLAPTANIHRVVGEVVTAWINECGGLLGRPVEWSVLDDQSVPENAAANYERLITVDNVDLVMGPYGAANTLAAASPVGRAGYIYPTHTNGSPQKEIGDFHFPSWQIGGGAASEEEIFRAAADPIWDALNSTGTLPATAFYVTNKFPFTVAFTKAAQRIGEERGVQTTEYVEYDLGTTDFSSIALRISAADPDFIFVGAIGLDIVNLYDAFATIGYEPRGIYAAVPSPGPTMALGEPVDGLMVLSIYENHPPFTDDPVAAEFTKRFVPAAEAEGLLSLVETQAAASMSAWQILLTAVNATGSLDHNQLKEWLHANEVPTIAGTLKFDGFNGYGVDLSRVVQIQGGTRYVVWPPDLAPAGVKVIYPIR